MLTAIVGFFVLLLLMLGAGALIFANLPARWRHLPDSGLRGLRGDLRRNLGHWELADIERYVLDSVRRSAQVTVRSAYLPNRISVELAGEDLDRFSALSDSLAQSLGERIEALRGCPAVGRGGPLYDLLGTIEIRISEGAKIAPGTAEVRTSFAADTVLVASRRTVSSVTPPQRLAQKARWLISTPEGTRELTGEVLFGRDATCRIRLKDPRVSARHARLTVDGEYVYLEDLDSTNGTRVNGRVLGARTALSSGDLLSFGSASALRIVYDRATEPVIAAHD